MPPSDQDQTVDLPGFTQATPLEDVLPPAAPPNTTSSEAQRAHPSAARPTTSIPSLPPSSTPSGPTPPSIPPSSPTSGDVTEAVGDAIDNLAGDVFEIAGYILNKRARAKTKTNTTLWLVSPEESIAFAEAAGRMASRRLPDELQEEGDVSDLFVMATVALGYAAHNAMGLSGAELEAAQAAAMAGGGQPQPATAPPAAPPAQHTTVPVAQPQAPAPAMPPAPAAATVTTRPVVNADLEATSGPHGAVAATPPPPDVISPMI